MNNTITNDLEKHLLICSWQHIRQCVLVAFRFRQSVVSVLVTFCFNL